MNNKEHKETLTKQYNTIKFCRKNDCCPYILHNPIDGTIILADDDQNSSLVLTRDQAIDLLETLKTIKF